MKKGNTRKINKKVILALSVLVLIIVTGMAYFVFRDRSISSNQGVCKVVDTEQLCTEELTGLSEVKATELARAKGFNPVITSRDGKGVFHTLIKDSSRVYLTIQSGTVTKAKF